MTQGSRTIPRPEHPQPQMRREHWQNLNGEWDFAFDFEISGMEKNYQSRKEWDQKILVPFCPESRLSGIGFTDFIPAVWYHRAVIFSGEQLGQVILLHFGAVDYDCRVWVNGVSVGRHKGGYTSFCFDITAALVPGENHIWVYAEDDVRGGNQPKGKQSDKYASHGCDYTRTTGIWQTVWLEFVPHVRVEKLWYYPNPADRSVTIKAKVRRESWSEKPETLRAEAFFGGTSCGKAAVKAGADTVFLTLSLSELHLWEPGQGALYDLELSFGTDRIHSYFGMREIRLEGEKFLINGKPVFQRLILDQGFYPDGIYTAADEAALEQDISLSLKAGFNGARLHQKVFEPRFLYHCDRLGYLVWGEMANWGLNHSKAEALQNFLPEWMEVLERDFSHPSVIGWCPFNETWDFQGCRQDDDLLRTAYRMTKQYDTTRPCIDTSGNFHVETDIYDLHDYEQSPDVFYRSYHEFAEGGSLRETFPERQKRPGNVPTFISEFGGIRWDAEGTLKDGWGYGKGPATTEEFVARYKGLVNVLLDNPRMFGFCYTQLYDVEQEINGLYTYDRKPKFDMEEIRAITAREAAVEREKKQ